MNGLLHQLGMSLRLYYRNTMALIYGYLFPSIFLVAFWVLYRYDRVPLVRHMGELLTIAVLGGACFGLPTTMVSERERGVWRRYRLTPIPTGTIVTSTVAARYVILLTAGLLQVVLAMAVGMPLPRHPAQLWIAFTFVSFAFLGLGLVIAMLADNVPAVQALGQCIFLPMLILGGVAVQLASLPPWAQHLSAFFPGRYAVEAIQSSVNGSGLASARFDLIALLFIGAAGCLAGAKLFRWDAQQRFATRGGKAWVIVALFAWAAVGVTAEARGHIAVLAPTAAANVPAAVPERRPASSMPAPSVQAQAAQEAAAPAAAASPSPTDSNARAATDAASPSTGAGQSSSATASPSSTSVSSHGGAASSAQASTPAPSANASSVRRGDAKPGAAPGESAPSTKSARAAGPAASNRTAPSRESSSAPGSANTSTRASPGVSPDGRASAPPSADAGYAPPTLPSGATTWQGVTMQDIDATITFDGVPPDSGVVTPIARADDQPDADTEAQLNTVYAQLPNWAPGKVADPVQRVRNLLYVAAVPDVMQIAPESYLPLMVYDQLQQAVPKNDLVKILFWIAIHPYDGDDSAVTRLHDLGLPDGPVDPDELRNRAGIYAVKLLGRLTGKRPAK
jgi:hypothetical protein